MSRMTNRLQLLPTAIIDQILRTFPDLQYEHRMQFKRFLSSAKIATAFIRENIIDEGVIYRNGILIIEGALVISKKVGLGRLVFAQLGLYQVANLQNFLYERAHYTVSVHSSLLKYIQIPEQILKYLFYGLEKIIMEKQKNRNFQIQQKLQQILDKQKNFEKQKMINRLSLPAIKYLGPQAKPSFKSQINSPKQTNNSLEKSKSSRNKLKPKSLSKILTQISTKLMGVAPGQRIQKIKSESQHTSDRNQKIFKEQLKTIIKRKLVFQRKQLGVLKAYRPNNKLIYEEDGYFRQPEQNRLDQYFKI